jgi:hypothetical protein
MPRHTKKKIAAKSAPWFAWGAGKAGKLGARSAGRAARAEAKLIKHALSSREPRSVRWSKYGALALGGVLIGILIGRLGAKDAREEIGERAGDLREDIRDRAQEARERAESARERVEEKVEETEVFGGEEPFPAGDAGDVEAVVPQEQEEVEQRLRTRLGEDPRTADLPRMNVQVIEGVAEIRGVVPSEEVKQAVEEIARETEGVVEVRNLVEVNRVL